MLRYILIISTLLFSTFLIAQEESNFLNGLAKFYYQEYDSSIIYFNKAIELNKNDARIYSYIGNCYLIKQDLEKAKESYESADKIKTGYGSYQLARICAMQKDFPAAIKWLEVNLKSEYKIPKSEIRTNDAFVDLRETKEWENLWSGDWYTEDEIIIESADYLKERTKYVDALEELDKIIFKDKTAHYALYKRAEVYLMLDDTRNALTDLNSAIKINNEVYIYHFKRALLLMNQRKYKKALLDLNKAIEINSEDFDVFYQRALVETKLQMNNEAIADLEYYLTYMTKNEIAYYKGGTIYLSLNKYDKALVWLNRAIFMNSNIIDYFIARVQAHEGLQDYNSMMNDCSRALDINPNEGIIYYKRGIAKYNLNDKDGACKDWKNAVRFDYFDANEMLLNECQ